MKKILLVDDDNIFRTTVIKAIGKKGFKVLEAESGSAAWAIIQSESIDLVVSDVQMPDGDGVWLLKQILKGVRIPVILMSGGASITREEALRLGANDFLSKPFSHQLLLATAHQVLAKKNALTGS